jgi:hypothetical protein
VFNKGKQEATRHNLSLLLQALPSLQRSIMLERTGIYKNAWYTITRLWQQDGLRYYDKVGSEHECQSFMTAIAVMHAFILREQRGAS